MKENFHQPESKEQKTDIYAVLNDLIGRYEQVTTYANRLNELPKLIQDHKLEHLELADDEKEQLRVLMGSYMDSRYSEDSLKAILDYLRSLGK